MTGWLKLYTHALLRFYNILKILNIKNMQRYLYGRKAGIKMRTKKRGIVFVLLVIVCLFSFFVLMNIQEIMDYTKIEAAGRKVLTPVNVKQKKTKRYNKGRTTETVTNYVQFVVEINNSRRSFYMKTSDAYGENSPSVGIAAVTSKKKIERYIFYTDKNIYYSKKATTTSEYIEESVSDKLLVFCIIMVFIGLVFLVVNISDKIIEKRRMNANS